MPDKQPTPIAIDQLGSVFGPSIGYYIARCRHGGYLLIVDGAAHSAHGELAKAVAAMGQVAADQYGESAVLPEQAKDVTPAVPFEPIPRGIRPEQPRVVRPPETAPLAERARSTAILVLGLLAVGTRGLMGV